MIYSKVRASLSQNVRWLVGGRITNDDFDDIYYDLYEYSDDKAIAEIGHFCWCLYSSDLPLPYRLKGIYAVDEVTRSIARRCTMFLRSGLEYEWPPFPDRFGVPELFQLAFFGIPAGLGTFLISLPGTLAGTDNGFWLPPTVGGGIVFLTSIVIRIFGRRMLSEDAKIHQASGDFDVWPFLRRKDFEKALRSSHLFAS